MPVKRKNTRKKASPGQSRAYSRAGSKKQENSDLKLVLKRLDEFDRRFDVLDQKIDALDKIEKEIDKLKAA